MYVFPNSGPCIVILGLAIGKILYQNQWILLVIEPTRRIIVFGDMQCCDSPLNISLGKFALEIVSSHHSTSSFDILKELRVKIHWNIPQLSFYLINKDLHIHSSCSVLWNTSKCLAILFYYIMKKSVTWQVMLSCKRSPLQCDLYDINVLIGK